MDQEVLHHVCNHCSWAASNTVFPRVMFIYIDKVDQEADSAISFDVLMIARTTASKSAIPCWNGARSRAKWFLR
jgi:hypothetical protein